jgi:hypothetical protein
MKEEEEEEEKEEEGGSKKESCSLSLVKTERSARRVYSNVTARVTCKNKY